MRHRYAVMSSGIGDQVFYWKKCQYFSRHFLCDTTDDVKVKIYLSLNLVMIYGGLTKVLQSIHIVIH